MSGEVREDFGHLNINNLLREGVSEQSGIFFKFFSAHGLGLDVDDVINDGGQRPAVCDDEKNLTLGAQRLNGTDDSVFADGVEVRGWFVEDDGWGVFEESANRCEALTSPE